MSGKDLPPVPEQAHPELRRLLQRLREEVQALRGFRGSLEFKAVTGSGASVGQRPVGPGGGQDETPDLTPPPTPAFASVSAGFSSLIIEWSGIGYTQGGGHSQTIIYGVQRDPSDANLPTFPGDAGIVAIAPNALSIYALPSSPNTRWHLWLKFKTADGVVSAAPAGGTNGFNVSGAFPTTGQDISQLLGLLSGAITDTELSSSLNTRISLVDGAANVPGSVDARIDARSSLLTSAYQQADAQTVTAAVGVANAYTNQYAYSIAQSDQAIATSVGTVNARLNDFGGSGATVETRFTATAGTVSGLTGLYSVKMDLNGFMSGFGLQSDLIAGGTPTSTFIVNVDKFAVTTPITSVQPWAASTSVAANNTRRIAGTDNKLLVCKTPGVTGSSAPPIAGAIGSLVADGSAVWQIASTTPMATLTTPTTINGVALSAGTYIDGAFILNASIGAAQIRELTADKITTGTLNAGLVFAGELSAATGTFAGELSAATGSFEGSITATSGEIGGMSIGADYIRSTDYVPGLSGWRLSPTGAQLPATNIVGLLTTSQIQPGLLGNAWSFAGELSAATGTFSGTLRVGNNPAISGTTMTGSGAVINADGTFALGTAAGNITYNGTGAPVLNGFETPVFVLSTYSVSFTANSDGEIDAGTASPVNMFVRRGAVDESSLWTFALSAVSDPSVSTSGSGATQGIAGIGASLDIGWAEFTAARSGYATQGPLRVNITKVRRPAPDSGPVAMPGIFDATASQGTPVDASVYIEFRRDGSIWGGEWAGAKLGDWYLPNSASAGDGFDVRFDIAATFVTEAGGVGGQTMGVWEQLNAPRTITLTTSEDFTASRRIHVNYTIRRRTNGSQVCSGTAIMRAEVENVSAG